METNMRGEEQIPDDIGEERETMWLIESYVNGQRIDSASHTSSDPVYVETLKETQQLRPKAFSIRVTEYRALASRLYDGGTDAECV